MKSVQDHLSEILGAVDATEPLDLVLQDAPGCILAEDIAAPFGLPRFEHADTDGYAVRSADVAEASPSARVSLRVLGDLSAGVEEASALVEGAAFRVSTGAPTPPSADAIVPITSTDRGMATVQVSAAVKPGDYIRRANTDVLPGDLVVARGTELQATHVGALAGMGMRTVPVYPRPRVVIISTGNEVVDPGSPLRGDQVADANSFLLAEAVREAGGAPYRIGVVADDTRELRVTLEDQLVRADMIITTGGVSVGEDDVVKEVLAPLGTVRFDQIGIEPGSRQGFGTVGDDVPIFALPGKPASAFIAFEVFVRPGLRRMRGLTSAADLYRPVVDARVTAGWHGDVGKNQFMPVALERDGSLWTATPILGGHAPEGAGLWDASGNVASLAHVNGLAVTPAGTSQTAAGTSVRVMRIA